MNGVGTIKNELADLKSNAYKNYNNKGRPSITTATLGFFKSCGVSLYLIFTEKENILFAFMSLVCMALVYFFGIKVLDWIPQEVWDSLKAEEGKNHTLLDLILIIWAFICVGIVAYPLGIFTACMGASYMLRFQGKESTISECLKIVLPKSWTLWIFSWIDGWWTFCRIVDRLPKKNDRTPASTKIMKETIYQAWKLASLGFLPATVCGRNLKEACADSLKLMKDRFSMQAKLRIGYSVVCWIVGIGSYIGTIFMVFYSNDLKIGSNEIYSFYFLAGAPIVVALTIIMLFFRPLYIISACRIYAFYAREKGIEVELPEKSPKFVSSLIVFLLLLAAVAVVYLWRDELGLSDVLSEKINITNFR